MEYLLTPAANGWLLRFHPEPGAPAMVYVFDSIREMAEWLAQRHGEAGPRKLIEDWH